LFKINILQLGLKNKCIQQNSRDRLQ